MTRICSLPDDLVVVANPLRKEIHVYVFALIHSMENLDKFPQMVAKKFSHSPAGAFTEKLRFRSCQIRDFRPGKVTSYDTNFVRGPTAMIVASKFVAAGAPVGQSLSIVLCTYVWLIYITLDLCGMDQLIP